MMFEWVFAVFQIVLGIACLGVLADNALRWWSAFAAIRARRAAPYCLSAAGRIEPPLAPLKSKKYGHLQGGRRRCRDIQEAWSPGVFNCVAA